MAEGSALSLEPARFNDPGTLDTHVAGIDIGFDRVGRARTRVIRISAAADSAPERGGARLAP